MPSSQIINIILKNRGWFGFYYGLPSGVIRQLTFSATRFGMYEYAKHQGIMKEFSTKVAISSITGLFVGFLNTPMEKVNIQKRSEAMRPPHKNDTFHLIYRLYLLYGNGGVKNLFTAAIPSAFHCMCLSIGQLSVYDQIKEQLLTNDQYFKNNWKTFLFASLVAGGTAVIIATPVQVVKSIAMNAKPGEFNGNIDIIKNIAALHGAKGFYKGFIPTLFRLIPHTILTFLIYEALCFQFDISNNS